MGKRVEIITPLHTRTKRDYLSRMVDDKVACMLTAKKYGAEYWDGDRRFGYGGYNYDGRWKSVAQELIERYELGSGSRVLDMGCGKAHLLYELITLCPDIEICGIDISSYAIENAPEKVQPFLQTGRAEDPISFDDKHFDLAISLGCFHNLNISKLFSALREFIRVSHQHYCMVESYRNEQELFNLQCWALTAESFFDTSEWEWIYGQCEYDGDYEFIFFE